MKSALIFGITMAFRRIAQSRAAGPAARRAAAILLAAALLPCPAVSARAQDVAAAIAVVERIQALTLDAAKVSANGRTARLAPALDRYLDLDDIASKILGPAFARAESGERRDFKQVLRDGMAAELARKIRPGDRFGITGARAINARDIVVLSVQNRSGGNARRLDWKLRPCRASYCVFDLVSNGASLSLARRDDYAARLAAAGGSLAALTRSLRADLARAP